VGWLYAFERAGGALRWKRAFPRGVSSQILGRGDRVYAVGGAGDVLALDVATGAEAWRFVDEEPAPGSWATHDPALSGELLLVPWPDGAVVALDAAGGRERWRALLGSRPSTSVAATSSAAWIGTEDGKLRKLDVASGAALLEVDAGGRPYGDLQVAGGCLLVLTAADRHALSCRDPATGAVRWRREEDAEISTYRPLVTGGVVIAGDESRQLFALAADGGEERWRCAVSGVPRGLADGGGHLFVGMLAGAVVAIPAGGCGGGPPRAG
jgi:outer membrane protein assembly factor BamB